MNKQASFRVPIKFVRRGFTGHDVPEDGIMQKCVRCGLCLPTCPTYLETLRETSSPRGRIHLMEAVAAGKLDLTDPGFVGQMYQCLDCRACEAVCPSGVEYGKLVEAARTQIERAMPGSTVKRGLRWLVFHQIFGNMRVFRLLCRLLLFYQRSGLQRLVRKCGILSILRLKEAEELLPTFPKSFLSYSGEQYGAESLVSTKNASPSTSVLPVAGKTATQVALFAGCIMSTAFAETDRATIRVLLAAGCSVVVPRHQGCCGALTVHAGDMDRARVMARRNIDAFEQSGAEYIIVNAAGCGAALKDYGHLMRDDNLYAERAAHFSTQVRDITEFLASRSFSSPQHPLHLRITYQEPCHLVHAQRIDRAPRELLHSIPGIELIEMRESSLCCGSAGIYNITQPEMSRRLQERKIKQIQKSGADLVVTSNPGCYLQLQSGLRQAGSTMRVVHIVDLLDMAYRQE
ncbi:MAG: (Fe-S)-binding protein [Ktedonobacteraceae bacterium]